MMDAVEYLKTLHRMCTCECCSQCEFGKRLSVLETCTDWRKTHPDESVAIVEKWAKKHPVKTRQSVFLKHYPNARFFQAVSTHAQGMYSVIQKSAATSNLALSAKRRSGLRRWRNERLGADRH